MFIVIDLFTQHQVFPQPFIRSLYFLKNFHALGYSIFILIYMRRYRASLKHQYSNIESLSLSWISNILAILILYFVVISPVMLILYVTDFKWILEYESIWTPILISIYIFFLGFNGIRNHQVFMQSMVSQKDAKDSYSDDQVYRLERVIETDKPYLQDSLTLDSLSELTHIPSHILSRITNIKFKMNFYDFINSYRVSYFNSLYLNAINADRTILDMALESGFYSKSTFNLSYKKLTGMTPTQFRKSSETIES